MNFETQMNQEKGLGLQSQSPLFQKMLGTAVSGQFRTLISRPKKPRIVENETSRVFLIFHKKGGFSLQSFGADLKTLFLLWFGSYQSKKGDTSKNAGTTRVSFSEVFGASAFLPFSSILGGIWLVLFWFFILIFF